MSDFAKKPALKLEVGDVVEIYFNEAEPFWNNGESYGWNIMHDGAEKVFFATARFNGEILEYLARGKKQAYISLDLIDFHHGNGSYKQYAISDDPVNLIVPDSMKP